MRLIHCDQQGRTGSPNCLYRAGQSMRSHIISQAASRCWTDMPWLVSDALLFHELLALPALIVTWWTAITCIPLPLPFLGRNAHHSYCSSCITEHVVGGIGRAADKACWPLLQGNAECRKVPFSVHHQCFTVVSAVKWENCCPVQNAKKISARIYFALNSASIYQLIYKNESSNHLYLRSEKHVVS
jgi:hypothetical protein